MATAAAVGLEVLVLADHNSVDWVDTMLAAGQRHGIVVFPGLEITTATGSDGAHLILFMGPERSAEDLRPLLYSACGFGPDHPPFNPSRAGEPAPAPNTVPQILDKLPDDVLAIAPHAFGENGLVRQDTVTSQLRWKALHHDRLGAIDIGDGAEHQQADTWRGRFTRRELTDFPCLPRLPFVWTSDAYRLEDLGSRYTWIRMQEPSLEGMRQAFLDHEARIICGWDSRYRGTAQTPNDVGHAYISEITLAGLATSEQPLKVTFDPRLTVLVGGRGAGKSTVVAGLRCLYGETAGLPTQARDEAERFLEAVFGDASITAVHHLPHTGEHQRTTWTLADGSQTLRAADHLTSTDFRVRVIGQKELFERSAGSSHDPHSTSRNLLALVDDALAAGAPGAGGAAAFDRALDEARTTWVGAIRRLETEQTAIAERGLVRERVDELTRQVEAFDNEASRARRARNDRILSQDRELDRRLEETAQALTDLADAAQRRLPRPSVEVVVPDLSEAGEDAEAQTEYTGLRGGSTSSLTVLEAPCSTRSPALDRRYTGWASAAIVGRGRKPCPRPKRTAPRTSASSLLSAWTQRPTNKSALSWKTKPRTYTSLKRALRNCLSLLRTPPGPGKPSMTSTRTAEIDVGHCSTRSKTAVACCASLSRTTPTPVLGLHGSETCLTFAPTASLPTYLP
ncbi:hypothetical protein [Blastococcus sp. TF02-8]|uniref:hypothetical protein n=1 Tax=Blastococcus sp. TF02-8 TaxID=2250574 RepID=UPI003514BADC